ncbi:MAG TPA: hypothetical protein VF541_03405 [Longimicrobium sp.]
MKDRACAPVRAADFVLSLPRIHPPRNPAAALISGAIGGITPRHLQRWR